MTKKGKPSRAPMTDDQLWYITPEEFLTLTSEEQGRLKEINKLKDLERKATTALLRAEQVPLVEDLRAVGLNVDSIDHVVRRAEPYPEAISVLMKHLMMPYSDVIRDSIARALAVPEPEVRAAWPMLVEEYRKAPTGWGITVKGISREYKFGLKGGLACTLAASVDEDQLPELTALAKDPVNGSSRVILLMALKKRRGKNPLVDQAIKDLAQDPGLAKEIASWTPNRKSEEKRRSAP
jgi:hypothetical protein